MIKKLVFSLSLLIALSYCQLQPSLQDIEIVNSPIKNQLLRSKLSGVENGNQINTDRAAAISVQNQLENFLIMEPFEQLPADHYGAYLPIQHGHEHQKHQQKNTLTPPGEPKKSLLFKDLVR